MWWLATVSSCHTILFLVFAHLKCFSETHLSHSRGWTPSYHSGRLWKCDNLLFWKGSDSAYLSLGSKNDHCRIKKPIGEFDTHWIQTKPGVCDLKWLEMYLGCLPHPDFSLSVLLLFHNLAYQHIFENIIICGTCWNQPNVGIICYHWKCSEFHFISFSLTLSNKPRQKRRIQVELGGEV